jgi:hypothetical protein
LVSRSAAAEKTNDAGRSRSLEPPADKVASPLSVWLHRLVYAHATSQWGLAHLQQGQKDCRERLHCRLDRAGEPRRPPTCVKRAPASYRALQRSAQGHSWSLMALQLELADEGLGNKLAVQRMCATHQRNYANETTPSSNLAPTRLVLFCLHHATGAQRTLRMARRAKDVNALSRCSLQLLTCLQDRSSTAI